jgi:hypothetical protein
LTIFHPVAPTPTQLEVAPEAAYAASNVQNTYVPPSTSLGRGRAEPIRAPVPRPPPTSYHDYHPHRTHSADSGYSTGSQTVSSSPAIGSPNVISPPAILSSNVNNQIADDATETSSIETRDSYQRSDSRRWSSRPDVHERRQQSRPQITVAQQHAYVERREYRPHPKGPPKVPPKDNKRSYYQYERRKGTSDRCVIM